MYIAYKFICVVLSIKRVYILHHIFQSKQKGVNIFSVINNWNVFSLKIAQCYEQAAVGNEAIFEEDQISLIKDTVSCILARTRCGNVNPITGQHQNNRITTTIYDKWGKPQNNAIPLYNSLQITPENDLRIVNFPGTTKIQNYFCRSQPNLKESSWLEFSC